MLNLETGAARARKWEAGRAQFGPGPFVGDPLDELDDELIDAMNYAAVGATAGLPLEGILADLQGLRDRVRALAARRAG